MQSSALSRPGMGIVFVLVGILTISVNDMLIKQLSGGYPLHQVVFTRSAIGLLFGLAMVQVEGGWSVLRTRQPGLHMLRGLMVVIANMTYFLALAVLPLADATALFFAAPLFITLLSIPLLGEKVGPLRMGAVIVGFAGVVIMQRPWQGSGELEVSRLVLLHGVYDRNAEQRAGVRSRLQQAIEDGPAAIIDAAISRWFTPDFQAANPAAIDRVRARLEANQPRDFLAAYRVFAEADAELAGRIMNIRCPTTIATGELDAGSTPFMSQEMATEIPGARCEIFDGLAHGAPVEDPARVTDLIRRALLRRAGT